MNKRCIGHYMLLIFTFIVLAPSFSLKTKAEGFARVDYDFNQEQLIITGNIGLPDKKVALFAIRTSTGKPVLVTQNTSLEGGDFVFTISFDILEKGNYEFTISAENKAEVLTLTKYFDPQLIPGPTPTPSRPSSSGGRGGTTVSGDASFLPVITPVPVLPPEEISFSDVTSGHWAESAINSLAKQNVLTGVGDNVFGLDLDVTREQFAKMIILAFELSIVEDDIVFSDTDRGSWSYPYLVSAYKYGIMNGYSETEMGGSESMTRQELCALVYRALQVKEIELEPQNNMVFSDEESIDVYAKDSVNALRGAGIVTGMGENRFAPKENVTRAMAAVILNRAINIK